METARHFLIGLCTGALMAGPLAAQTAAGHAAEAPAPGSALGSGPGPGLEATQMAQAVLQLSAPRAVQVDGLAVGDNLDPARLHVITRPGLYGLNRTAPGDRFGVVEGLLVRFDPTTMRLKSIIRAGVTPID